jgi:carboxypeptidase C (cathepsin A)
MLLTIIAVLAAQSAASQDTSLPPMTPPEIMGEASQTTSNEGPSGSRAAISSEQGETRMTWSASGEEFDYTVRAGFVPLGPEGEPEVEIFHTSYLREGVDAAERPITFVFNGGPGAASVYLHMGALGPMKIAFTEDGDLPPPPVRLEDNPDSWLPYTDLVFIDPVGTGFSRFVGEAAEMEGGEAKGSAKYHSVMGDLTAMGEFIERYLAETRRFRSPVVVAGESYGGFRAAMLAQMLPKEHDVPLSGSVLISPKFDLFGGRSDGLHPAPWITRVPSYAASAASQGKGLAERRITEIGAMEEIMAEAEDFAVSDFARYLVQGEMMPKAEQVSILRRFAELTGLPEDYVRTQRGRVTQSEYASELLREKGQLVGIYDATVAVTDPDPERYESGYANDPLFVLSGSYRAGLLSFLSEEVGFALPDRRYDSLSGSVGSAWRYYVGSPLRPSPPAAANRLREGLAMNKHLKVWITHGAMDLQTPYFESAYVINNLGIPEPVRNNVRLDTYYGGHMYYMHRESSRRFAEDAGEFFASLSARGERAESSSDVRSGD